MKLLSFCIVFMMIMASSTLALSCVQVASRPVFNVITSQFDKCSFFPVALGISAKTDLDYYMRDNNMVGYYTCSNLKLDEYEDQIFREVINQFANIRFYFSSANIEKQTDSEFISFQKKADSANADNCDCVLYSNITRYVGWTVYVKSENCQHDPSCATIPPDSCFQKKVYDVMRNPKIMIPVAIIVPFLGLMILLQFLKKES
jgi:hypothetical protein